MRPRQNAQEDYLIRMIQQAAEVLRRLRHRLSGAGGSPEENRREAAATVELLLGVQSSTLAMLDPVSAVTLVGRADVVHVWAALLDIEAGAIESDDAVATRLRGRAQSLRDAAAALWGVSS